MKLEPSAEQLLETDGRDNWAIINAQTFFPGFASFEAAQKELIKRGAYYGPSVIRQLNTFGQKGQKTN